MGRPIAIERAMPKIFAKLFLLVVLLAAFNMSASASDPLRFQQGFEFLNLGQYMQPRPDGQLEFAIQNAGSQDLPLIIQNYPTSDVLRALDVLRLGATENIPMRLFASDNTEFATPPAHGGELAFYVPANSVITYYLSGARAQQLYLWSPTALEAFDARQTTMRLTIFLLLLVLFAYGVVVAVQRQSRRAAYALIMALGLMVLLVSLWMQAFTINDVTGNDVNGNANNATAWAQNLIAPNRLLIIRIAFAFWLVMLLLGHLNLIIRVVVHRNFWTRVIIFNDLCLLATISLCLAALILMPNFFGIISNAIIDVAFSLSCICVLLGVIFVPDRQR